MAESIARFNILNQMHGVFTTCAEAPPNGSQICIRINNQGLNII